MVAAVLPAECKTLILETWADQSCPLFHVVVWGHPTTISEQLLVPEAYWTALWDMKVDYESRLLISLNDQSSTAVWATKVAREEPCTLSYRLS